MDSSVEAAIRADPARSGPVRRRSVVGNFAFILEMPAHAGGRQPQPKTRPSRHGGRGEGAGGEAVRATDRPSAVRGSDARDDRLGVAAAVIPFVVAPRRREATAKIRFAEALTPAIDLDESQYIALHDGSGTGDLGHRLRGEFVIDRIGRQDERHFQDFGIEDYRFVDDDRTVSLAG